MKITDRIILHLALEKGHFIFASGNHATMKLEFDNISKNPILINIIAKKLAKLISVNNPDLDLVVTIASGANILAKPTSNQLSKMLKRDIGYIATTKNSKKDFLISSNQKIQKGSKCVVVDDVYNHGTNSSKVIELLKRYQVDILSIAVVFNRNAGQVKKSREGFRILSLINFSMEDWSNNECKVCNNKFDS